jgi:hypothetical protein
MMLFPENDKVKEKVKKSKSKEKLRQMHKDFIRIHGSKSMQTTANNPARN